MSKTKQIELINDAYRRLVWAVDNIDWRHYATELLDLEKGYEKRHRDYAKIGSNQYVFKLLFMLRLLFFANSETNGVFTHLSKNLYSIL